MTSETEMTLFKIVEFGQQNIQTKNKEGSRKTKAKYLKSVVHANYPNYYQGAWHIFF